MKNQRIWIAVALTANLLLLPLVLAAPPRPVQAQADDSLDRLRRSGLI